MRSVATALVLLAPGCGDDTGPENPIPSITEITPAQTDQGRGELTLTITGSDFVPSSGVRLNGSARTTEFVSTSQLRATLPAPDFASSGTHQITVYTPPPGGGTSNTAVLAVSVPPNPTPVISGVSPEFLPVGSPAGEITITGSGFIEQSYLFVGFQTRPATYVSPTELRITILAQELSVPASYALRVVNPGPGGGVSGEVPFEVRAPVPEITSLGETSTIAGQVGYTLRVNGTGFLASSTVRVNDAPRSAQYLAAGAIDVTLTELDLRVATTLTITVTNPGPGGGTSSGVAFAVVTGTPAIGQLPSSGAAAGSSGFTLYVHGIGFVPGTVVRWNGSDRSTQYLSGTRVAATISAADVGSPGTVQITVFNPAPGGGTSSPATFTIRQLGAQTWTIDEIPLTTRDIGYSPVTGRLYASIPGSTPAIGNHVAAIDPVAATVTGSVFVGSEPGKLALSDDGQLLYVGLDGANAVRRVDLPSFTPNIQWSVGAGLVAGDIGVVPGMPNAVAVSRQSPGSSPPLVGVTIYDDGVARPVSSPGHTGGNRIEFLETPAVLYGYNNAHTGFEFFRIGISATGAVHLSATGGLIGGFETDIVGEAGRIYGTDGSIVDAEARTRIGSFPGSNGLAVDPLLGRAYLLNGSQLYVYDLNNFQLLGSASLGSVVYDPSGLSRVVRWGTDGLAFRDQTRIFIIRSPLVSP